MPRPGILERYAAQAQAAGKVPAPMPASPGASTSTEEAYAHPSRSQMGDQPLPALAELLGSIAELAQAVSTDDVIDCQTVLLATPVGTTGGGSVSLASTALVGSIAVLNLGTRVMAVVASQAAGGPPPQGQGQTLVWPGQLVVMPLGGTVHTLYGAQGDAATVVRYASVRQPSASATGGGAFTPNVPNPTGGGIVFYTAPFPGVIPAYLTDYEAGNPGATVARIKAFDGSVATGLEILDVTIPIGGTVAEEYNKPRLLATGILTIQQVSGDAGDPKVLVGVQ